MSDVDNLLDELSGRLTAVTVKYPDTQPFIESLHQHIRFALENPEKARYSKLLPKAKKWLEEMKWKHPIFRHDFAAMVEAIDKFEQR